MEIANQFNGLFDSPGKILETVSRFGPPIVSVILVASIAWLLASLTVTVLPRPEAVPAPVTARPAQTAPTPAPGVSVQAIVNRHLFGQFVDTPAPVIVDEDVPPTNLPLTLLGAVASTDADRSLAIIEQGGDAKVYTIGDTIQSGVTLQAVQAKAVFLMNRGQRQILELPRADEGGSPTLSSRRSNARTATSPRRRQATTQAKPLAAASGAAKLGDFIRPQPVFANGKQRGYRVYPGRQRDQFSALGLKAGDLVTEINGSPLDDPARGLEVFRSIAGSTQVQVTIERNGSPTSLVLDTSQLNLGGADQ